MYIYIYIYIYVMRSIYKSNYQYKLYYVNYITAFKQGQNYIALHITVHQSTNNLDAASSIAVTRVIWKVSNFENSFS